MKDVLLYMTSFFMLFFSCALVGFCLRFSFWIYTEYWERAHRVPYDDHSFARQIRDRQGNDCAQGDETGRDNRYNDIFIIEPNRQEAARIRAQLEKDDKDLPSYDEVMRIANISTPTTVSAAANVIPTTPNALRMGASTSSFNTTNTTFSVPPSYREVETNVRPLAPPPYITEHRGDSVVLPITTPIHSQQHTQST